MQAPASELRRILLPRSRVNRAKKKGHVLQDTTLPNLSTFGGGGVSILRTRTEADLPRSSPVWTQTIHLYDADRRTPSRSRGLSHRSCRLLPGRSHYRMRGSPFP